MDWYNLTPHWYCHAFLWLLQRCGVSAVLWCNMLTALCQLVENSAHLLLSFYWSLAVSLCDSLCDSLCEKRWILWIIEPDKLVSWMCGGVYTKREVSALREFTHQTFPSCNILYYSLRCVTCPAVSTAATSAQLSSLRLDYILMQGINQGARQLIIHSNEMLINQTHTFALSMHPGSTESWTVCLLLLLLLCLIPTFFFPFCCLRRHRFSFSPDSLRCQRAAPPACPSASQSFNFLPWWKALKLIAPSVYYMPPPLASPPPLPSLLLSICVALDDFITI